MTTQRIINGSHEQFIEASSDLLRHAALNHAIESHNSRTEGLAKVASSARDAFESLPPHLIDRFSEQPVENVSLITAPVRKAQTGLKGPTLLVNYPLNRADEKYVVKWTTTRESDGQRLFTEFAKGIEETPKYQYGFSVPTSSWIDQSRKVRVLTNGEIEALTDQFDAIDEIFAQIPSS